MVRGFGKPKSRITECIGFTRLPAATKLDLLNKGVKSRSLLRTLLATPVEQHAALIAEAMKNEAGDEPAAIKTKNLKPGDRVNKGDLKPFTFEANTKKVKISGLVWKVGEGKERLSELHAQIQKLAGEIEALMKEI